MSKSLRSILIGYGYWGKILESYLVKSPFYQLCGIYGRNFTNAQIPHNIDIAFVATPLDSHYEISKQCLESNLCVFIEKPTCKNSQELNDLYDEANKRKLKIYTDYIYLVSPSIQKIHSLLGSLGKLNNIESYITQYGRFYDNENALEVLGVHLLSIFVSLFEHLVLESCKYNSLYDISLHLKTSECPILIHCNLESKQKRREIHIYGEQGELHFDMLAHRPLCYIKQGKQKYFNFDEHNNIIHTLALCRTMLDEQNSCICNAPYMMSYAKHCNICLRILKLMEQCQIK